MNAKLDVLATENKSITEFPYSLPVHEYLTRRQNLAETYGEDALSATDWKLHTEESKLPETATHGARTENGMSVIRE